MRIAHPKVGLVVLTSLCLGLVFGSSVLAGPPTNIVIDGVNDFDEDEAYPGTSSSTWYFSYDAANFYFGLDATDVGSGSATKFVVLYLGTGTAGTTTGVLYNTQQPGLPFPATFHFRWKTDNSYINMLDYNSGTGSWTDDNTDPSNFGIQGFQSGTYVEFSIPRASLGDPDNLDLAGSMIDEQGGAEFTFFMVPVTNTEGYDADFTTFQALPLLYPIPTLGEWALLLLAILIAGLGWRALRKRPVTRPV